MKKKDSVFGSQIGAILSATPSSFDPEDDLFDGTNSNTKRSDSEDEGILSKLQKENVELLENTGKQFSKKKLSSRKNLSLDSNGKGALIFHNTI